MKYLTLFSVCGFICSVSSPIFSIDRRSLIKLQFCPLHQQQSIHAAPQTNTKDTFDHGTDEPKIDDYATNFDPLIDALVNLKSNATSGNKSVFIEMEKSRRSALAKIDERYKKMYDNIMSSATISGAKKQESFSKLKHDTNATVESINYVISKHRTNAHSLITSLENNQLVWHIKEALLNASVHQEDTSSKLHALGLNMRNEVEVTYKRYEEMMKTIEKEFLSDNNCSTEIPPSSARPYQSRPTTITSSPTTTNTPITIDEVFRELHWTAIRFDWSTFFPFSGEQTISA